MRVALATAAIAVVLSGTALAVPCKDPKGKFVKCPPVAAVAARCRDAKGHFKKCSVPGAKPA